MARKSIGGIQPDAETRKASPRDAWSGRIRAGQIEVRMMTTHAGPEVERKYDVDAGVVAQVRQMCTVCAMRRNGRDCPLTWSTVPLEFGAGEEPGAGDA